MKIRNGFVSNSSTTSFTCDSCGGTEAGMDLCLREVEMVECAAGHCIHMSCLDGLSKETGIDYEMAEDKYGEELLSNCPFCEFHVISAEEELRQRRAWPGAPSTEEILEKLRKVSNCKNVD